MTTFTMDIINQHVECSYNRPRIENNKEYQQEFHPYNGVLSFNRIYNRFQYGGIKALKI